MFSAVKAISFNSITKRFIVTALLFSFFQLPASFAGQSKRDLEKKKEQIEKDIEYTNQLLKQTRKSKTSSLGQLIALNKKISYRIELINTINGEINGLDGQINYTGTQIDSLQRRMETLQKHYADLLYFAYKNQSSLSKLTFIFSATDFNQAYRRLKYLQELSAYRIHQHDLIVQLEDSLSGKKNRLQDVKHDKTRLLGSQQKEKTNLDQEKQQQVAMVNELSSREKKLRSDLKEKQKAEARLDKMIEDAIHKEIEAARLAALKEQARKKKSASPLTASTNKKLPEISHSPTVLAMTPEAQKLSDNFESNRGKLPWPVEQGFISSSFGRHAHPIWKDVVVSNSGVDINSSKGAKVRSIFEGRVTKVIVIMNKYAIIIQHGEYFTVYSNLKEVAVKSGDMVTTKQVLGMVQTDDDDGKSEVHLEIWKGSNKMDPEGWIMARN